MVTQNTEQFCVPLELPLILNVLAFRDRNAGRNNNREKTTEEAQGPRRPRGDRGRNDRQSRTGQT